MRSDRSVDSTQYPSVRRRKTTLVAGKHAKFSNNRSARPVPRASWRSSVWFRATPSTTWRHTGLSRSYSRRESQCEARTTGGFLPTRESASLTPSSVAQNWILLAEYPVFGHESLVLGRMGRRLSCSVYCRAPAALPTREKVVRWRCTNRDSQQQQNSLRRRGYFTRVSAACACSMASQSSSRQGPG